jgi:cytochrome P450
MSSHADFDPLDGKHFDHMSPDLAEHLHGHLAALRAQCPVAHSEEHGGFWIVTRYADVLRVAQDWQTFSSAHGVSPGSLVDKRSKPAKKF